MQILVQWLKSQNVAIEQRFNIYEALKEPGVKIPKTMINEISQIIKNLLTNKSKRFEALLLLDISLDHIPDSVLGDHVVFFMKQLLTMSGTPKHAVACFTLLTRFINRLERIPYMQRDIRQDIFPTLIQCITREIVKMPVNIAVLKLTEALVGHFGKTCSPSRDAIERFLFKQIIHAEMQDVETSRALVHTIAMLGKSVSDPHTRHDVQTTYIEILIRSCEITQKFLMSGQSSEENVMGTIYAVANTPLAPPNHDTVTAKLVVWKRLALQLDCITAVLNSGLTKSIHSESLFKMLDKMLLTGARDEHLVFLHPSLIDRSVKIMDAFIGVCGSVICIKNNQITTFFTRAIDLTLQSDLSDNRTQVYLAMTRWFRTCAPSSFLKNRSDALVRILKIAMDDITDELAGAELVCAALDLVRAIVLEYGHRKADHIRESLMKLIPAMVDTTLPFNGIFRSNSKCRLGVYQVLSAFSINANTSLMPPSAEIRKRIAEGMFDDVYEVRETCKSLHAVIQNILDPIECGFRKSHSHALSEHNRELKRLALSKTERFRDVECQTNEDQDKLKRFVDRGTSTDKPHTVPQPMRAREIAFHCRPGPKSQKALAAKRQREQDEEEENNEIEEPDDEVALIDQPMDQDELMEDDPEDIEEEEENLVDEEDEDDEEPEEDIDEELIEYRNQQHLAAQAALRGLRAKKEHEEIKRMRTVTSTPSKQIGGEHAVVIQDDSDEAEPPSKQAKPSQVIPRKEESKKDAKKESEKPEVKPPSSPDDENVLPDSATQSQSPELAELQPVNPNEQSKENGTTSSKVNGKVSVNGDPAPPEVGPVVVAVASDDEEEGDGEEVSSRKPASAKSDSSVVGSSESSSKPQ